MSKMRLVAGIGLSIALSDCVIGSSPCLLLQVRHDVTGNILFREFPRNDGVDTGPILILDKTQYMYAPPQSFQCLPATDLQLVGLAELPDRIDEGTHVIVDGKVLEGVAKDQYTRFVIDVVSVLPFRDKH